MNGVSDGGGATSMVPEGGARGNELGPRLARRALVALLLVFPLAQLFTLALALAFLDGGEGAEEELAERVLTPLGMLVMVVPSQLTFLVAALGFARMHPRLPGGLGLRSSVLSPPLSALLVLGTPTVYGAGQVLGWLSNLDPGPSFEGIQRAIFESRGLAARLFVVLATLAPACCEELFFRGFVQRALALRFSGPIVVFVSGAVFALYHADPLHVLMVLPAGLWFAFLAHRSHSTWIAMAAHLAGNGTTMLLAKLVGEAALEGGWQAIEPVHVALVLAVYGGSAVALVTGLLLLRYQSVKASA